jgi:hypothetical protein
MGWQEWVLVVGLIIGCGTIFNILSFFGQRMLNKREEEEKQRQARENQLGFDNFNVAD